MASIGLSYRLVRLHRLVCTGLAGWTVGGLLWYQSFELMTMQGIRTRALWVRRGFPTNFSFVDSDFSAWIGLHWPLWNRIRVGKTVPYLPYISNLIASLRIFLLRFSLILSFYLQDNVIIKPVNKYGSREATASQVIRYGLLNFGTSSLMIWFEENY